MRLVPTSRHVVVQPISEETSRGGIVLPKGAGEGHLLRGKVLAVGPGSYNFEGERIPVRINEGDTVLYNSHAGDEYELDDGTKVRVVGDDSIVAIVLASSAAVGTGTQA